MAPTILAAFIVLAALLGACGLLALVAVLAGRIRENDMSASLLRSLEAHLQMVNVHGPP